MNMLLALLLSAFAAVAAPPLSPEVMDSPFGIVNPWPEVGHDGMGAVWSRCGGGATQLGDWPGNEPLPGVFRWNSAESEWAGFYVKEQLVPAPILSYTPRWASQAPGGDRSQPPANLWDYYRFCREISRRFAGRIWFWEIWNEPNIGFLDGTIAQYADMVKAGALGVLAGNPEAYVVFGGMAGVDQPFLDRCYQYGVREYFDVMAAHPYQWGKTFDDRWFNEKLTDLRRVMDAHGDPGKPVWLNELGWSTGDSNITEQDQARLLVQAYVTAMSRRDVGVERIFWFCVKDWGGPNYGLYAPDSRKKPGWHAYRNMVTRLTGLKCSGRLEIPEGIRGYLFSDEPGERSVAVLWSGDLEPRQVELPRAALAEAWDMVGESMALPEAAGESCALTVTPEPLFISVRGEQMTPLLSRVTPLEIGLPEPARRSPAWVSLYPQPGCSLPWLWRGQQTELRGRLFNAGAAPVDGEVLVSLIDPASGASLSETRAKVSAQGLTDASFTASIGCPEQAPENMKLRVSFEADGCDIAPLDISAFAADGPTVNFLANSYLERAVYLQPDAKGGCAESVRFGSEWSYNIPVAANCSATVRMDVGAHQAKGWTVAWSQDGKSWETLMEGESGRAMRSAAIEELKSGSLYLRCKGDGQQVGQVIVAFAVRADK